MVFDHEVLEFNQRRENRPLSEAGDAVQREFACQFICVVCVL